LNELDVDNYRFGDEDASSRMRRSAPPMLDERVLAELVRNPEAVQLVLNYLEKKRQNNPVRSVLRM
jgi:hypothetical protein